MHSDYCVSPYGSRNKVCWWTWDTVDRNRPFQNVGFYGGSFLCKWDKGVAVLSLYASIGEDLGKVPGGKSWDRTRTGDGAMGAASRFPLR